MNKYFIHLIAVVAVLLLMLSPALACGGKSCSARQCANKAAHAQSCTSEDKVCAMNKMGHAKEGTVAALPSAELQKKLCAGKKVQAEIK